MFRRLSENLLSVRRLPLKVELHKQTGRAQNVQRVRFGRRPWRLRNLIFPVFTLIACHNVYSSIASRSLDKTLSDSRVAEALEEIEKEQGEDDVGLFIPFPGTITKQPPRPYKESDPDWQEYLEWNEQIQKDRNYLIRMKKRFAEFVLIALEARLARQSTPDAPKRYPPKLVLQRYWLVSDFMYYDPQPDFTRTGIEITDDFVALTTMHMDPDLALQIKHHMWPSALMRSLWAFVKVLFTDEAKSISRALGASSSTPPPQSLERILALHQQALKGLPGLSKDGSAQKQQLPRFSESVSGEESAQLQQRMTQPRKEGDASKVIPDNFPFNTDSQLGRALLAVHLHLDPVIARAKQAFQQTWVRSRRSPHKYPPRGSFFVTGMVQISSPDRIYYLDVRGFWDPKTETIDYNNTAINLRSSQPKTLRPLREGESSSGL